MRKQYPANDEHPPAPYPNKAGKSAEKLASTEVLRQTTSGVNGETTADFLKREAWRAQEKNKSGVQRGGK